MANKETSLVNFFENESLKNRIAMLAADNLRIVIDEETSNYVSERMNQLTESITDLTEIMEEKKESTNEITRAVIITLLDTIALAEIIIFALSKKLDIN